METLSYYRLQLAEDKQAVRDCLMYANEYKLRGDKHSYLLWMDIAANNYRQCVRALDLIETAKSNLRDEGNKHRMNWRWSFRRNEKRFKTFYRHARRKKLDQTT